ncbi:acyl-CoA dehydrogenase family protein [Janibacter sp. GXQ6167]|uniref:acyl-CoA dehydrogenase family protein n=1 Tax=Janibacter sp. GXQ6167 TaxID=3240791 RepID=UPI003526A06B
MSPVHPFALIDLDHLLDDEERAIRSTVQQIVTDHVRPHLAQWFEAGTLPVRELAREFGANGLLGMHLQGYGCAGTSATAYGLACLEVEAADSGLRSLVSVQGSLAMYAIHRWGSEEQREQWLPGMAAGELIGCFGLTEPDFGSDPGGMRTRARRDGDDWILDGTKMWITNAPLADVAVIWARAEEGIRGFVVPTDTPGFTANEVTGKLSLRASATGEIVLDGVRLPSSAMLPEALGLSGPLSCLNEARFGIIFGAVGAARDSIEVTLDYVENRQIFGKPLAAYQISQVKLADMVVELDKAMLLALHLGRLKDAGRLRPEQVSVGKLNSCREAIAIARECRTLLGANGVTLEYSPMRHANNLESVLTYEGTSEVHQLIIGQSLTGHSAFR